MSLSFELSMTGARLC